MRKQLWNTFPRFLVATVVLAVVAYFLKGRDRGLSWWIVILGSAVYVGIDLLAGWLSARHSQE